GLTVSYASTTQSICTIVAGKVHILLAGTCTITASQAGGSNWYAAPNVNQTYTIQPRDANVAYIGQTVFVTSGSSSTTAQVTLTASVADTDGSNGTISNATVTVKDLLTNTVLASGVKVPPVSNSDTHTGTADT